MKIFKKNLLKEDSGFTIIETLVSVFILSVAVTAIQSFMVGNIWSAATIRNNYTASFLVQEGLEVVRNIRDNGWFAAVPFDQAINDGDWSVQWDDYGLQNSTAETLKRDENSGLFSYDNGINTVFSRYINIRTIVPGVEKRIITTVRWKEKGIDRSLMAEEHLFNWER